MSVYIPGMEMPTNCKDRSFSDHQAWCLIPRDWRQRYYCPDDKVNKECPLVPVPPHGDLIDREPFIQFIKTHWDGYDQWFVGQLEARPTIIPADPAKEGEQHG